MQGGGGVNNRKIALQTLLDLNHASPHIWANATYPPLFSLFFVPYLKGLKITSQRLLDQSQAGVYRGKRHIPPHFGHFGPIRVPYPKG